MEKAMNATLRNDCLRKAYDAAKDGDRAVALALIYRALDYARLTNDRIVRGHIQQCADRVKGVL